MCGCVSIGYTYDMQKNTGMRIRLERDLRDRFIVICREQDRPAAQVLREFMRAFIAEHQLPSTELGQPQAMGQKRPHG